MNIFVFVSDSFSDRKARKIAESFRESGVIPEAATLTAVKTRGLDGNQVRVLEVFDTNGGEPATLETNTIYLDGYNMTI